MKIRVEIYGTERNTAEEVFKFLIEYAKTHPPALGTSIELVKTALGHQYGTVIKWPNAYWADSTPEIQWILNARSHYNDKLPYGELFYVKSNTYTLRHYIVLNKWTG